MTLQRVIVTRPREHASRLSERLREIGIEPVIIPAVVFEAPATYDPLDAAIQKLNRYQWVLFTSRTGVRVFFERITAVGPASVPGGVRWAAVGPGTAEALAGRGIAHAWTPSRYLSEAAGTELPARPGDRVLRVRAEVASPAPAERLRHRGVLIDEVVAYRTVEAPSDSIDLLARAFTEGVDGVIFTSVSTVRGFARLAAAAGVMSQVPALTVIAIGPITADAARAQGWPVHLVADEYSLAGIVALLGERRQANASGIA